MYKSLLSLAAGTMLAAFAGSGPAAAADQDRVAGVGQPQQTEEFTSQRRRYRRGRVIVRHGYWGPRYGYWGPAPYAYAYPYAYPYGYAYAYPYRRYYRPGISFGIGPFGFHAW